MDAFEPSLLRASLRVASLVARVAIVLLLLLMLPTALITLAAAGPTLSDPAGSFWAMWEVGMGRT